MFIIAAAGYTATQVIGVAVGGTGVGILLHKVYRRLNGEEYKPSREHEESLKAQDKIVNQRLDENKGANNKVSSSVKDASKEINASLSNATSESKNSNQSTILMTQAMGGFKNAAQSLSETHQEARCSLPTLVSVSKQIHQETAALTDTLNKRDESINGELAQVKTGISDATNTLEQQQGTIERLTAALKAVSAERDQLSLDKSQLQTRLMQSAEQVRFFRDVAIAQRQDVVTEHTLPRSESATPSLH